MKFVHILLHRISNYCLLLVLHIFLLSIHFVFPGHRPPWGGGCYQGGSEGGWFLQRWRVHRQIQRRHLSTQRQTRRPTGEHFRGSRHTKQRENWYLFDFVYFHLFRRSCWGIVSWSWRQLASSPRVWPLASSETVFSSRSHPRMGRPSRRRCTRGESMSATWGSLHR